LCDIKLGQSEELLQIYEFISGAGIIAWVSS
jgi:hypothetical protein